MGQTKLQKKSKELQELHKDATVDQLIELLAKSQLGHEGVDIELESERALLTIAKSDLADANASLETAKLDSATALATAKAAQETAESDVEELNKQLADFESGMKKTPVPTVKVEGKTYNIVMPQINVKAIGLVTAADVKENKIEVATKDGKVKIANHLAAIKSGMLQLKG
jgi:hypothetical protein